MATEPDEELLDEFVRRMSRPGDMSRRQLNSEIMLFTIMQTGINQTKRFEYLDVRDAGG